MNKAEEFAALARTLFTMAQNQEIIKDEAIQACGERMMEFVMDNSELIYRALKHEEER